MRSRRRGMSTSATAARFDDVTMWVDLSDGRTLGVPLAWSRGYSAQRLNSGHGAGSA
ncbi:MAG TPA: DUF2442 domain-containing protein [Rhodopila sp.]|nr:DUF2442 domain-containing protein [Rhodopila sp.]